MRTFSLFLEDGKMAWWLPLLLALSLPGRAQFSQVPGSPVAVGGGPSSIAIADFNGDGIQDLAIADYSTGQVTVLLGNALGEFLPASASPFTAGSLPISIAVFNNKGNPSLAIANEGSSSITILLGNGTGAFTNGTAIQLPAGSAPVSIAAGDFGGNPGLVVAHFATKAVSLWLGNGSGIFTQAAGSPFAVGNNPSSIAIGDFNADGTPDFAVTNKLDGTVSVYVSNSAGGYGQAIGSPFSLLLQNTAVPPVAYPACIVTADFNGDGALDLAVANEGTNNVTVLLGNGEGGFGPTPYTSPIAPITVGSSPFSIAVGFFNNDSYPDLAVANLGDNTVTILLGSGTGGFAPPASGSPILVGTQPDSVAVGYFNGSGTLGLVIANKGSNTVSIFTSTASVPVVVSAASMTAPVAPGSIVSILGSGLGASATATGNLPSTLGGSIVTITDYTGVQTELGLMYTSATQINAVIPSGVNAGPNPTPVPVPPAVLSVFTSSDVQSAVVPLAPVAPGLFSANGTGKGVANALFFGAAVFQCPTGLGGTCVPIAIDVSAGGPLVLMATGIRNATGSVVVNIGDEMITASFAGSVGGTAGADGKDEVEVMLPANLPLAGLVPISVTVGGIKSNVVNIYVQ